MFLFIVAIVLGLAGLGALLSVPSIKARNKDRYKHDQIPLGAPIGAGLLALLLGVGAFFWSATYKLDQGEAGVMRTFGKVTGVDTTPGLSMKAPWTKSIAFDIRNNQKHYDALTFSDRNGTTGQISMDLTYNLEADGVGKVYGEYKSQAKFEEELVAKDAAAVLRSITPKFSNVEMMTKPGDVQAAMMQALSERWGDKWGVSGVTVALGTPVYPESITQRLESLTAEQTRAEEAKAATITAEEKAKQKLVEAKAESDANKLLEKSLTPGVLEQRRIDMLKSVGEQGNLIITDGKSTPLLNVDTKKGE